MYRGALCGAFLGMLTLTAPAAWAQEKVDLELVLAVDVSGSMDLDEQALQREGYAQAIKSQEVVAAIRSGFRRRIALTYVEWGGPPSQTVAIPWRVIEDQASADAFSAAVAAIPPTRVWGTSISASLDFTSKLFDDNGFEAPRRVIDISGDGPNNTGAPVEPARDRVLAQGIVINGLPILIKPSMGRFDYNEGLDNYYRDCVIGGPGSFMVPVTALDQFAPAIRRKLVLEISGLPPRLVPAAAEGTRPKTDCFVGERLRQMWFRE